MKTIPMIQLTAIADNDTHRTQVFEMLRQMDGCKLVRDLHSPSKPQQVCAYFDDDPAISAKTMPDGMRRVLVPTHWLETPAFKSICWSYPTSDNAKRFGFFLNGCWTVETHAERASVPTALAGFATRPEADAYAATINAPFHPYAHAA